MEHSNPLLHGNDSTNKFITIGEIMLRLTPPNYEKMRIWAWTAHFSVLFQTTVWEKVRFVCCAVTMCIVRLLF